MTRTKSRFDLGWLAEIDAERKARERAEELVQEVLCKAEERHKKEVAADGEPDSTSTKT